MVKKLIQKVMHHLRSRGTPPTKAPVAPKTETRFQAPVPQASPAPVVENQEFQPRRQGAARQAPRPPRPPRPAAPPQLTPEEADHSRRSKAHSAHATWDPASFQVAPCEGKGRFSDLTLAPQIMHAVADLGFQYCTPIQTGILPHTLQGRDAFGQAQTGTGKTAAFLITILQHLITKPALGPRKPGTPRALVLAPTRELCMQIYKDAIDLSKYSGTNRVAVFGGMDYEKQKNQLRGHVVDIVAATPDRLQWASRSAMLA